MSSTDSDRRLAELGNEFYARLRDDFVKNHPDEFVAIDVDSETVYFASTHEAALAAGVSASPHGKFHVVHVER